MSIRFLALALSLTACVHVSASRGRRSAVVADSAQSSPWVSLFDGTTLRGWRGLGSSGVPTAHWVVDNGTIRKIPSGKVAVQADGQPLEGGDLISEGTWRDFELEWEWKVAP